MGSPVSANFGDLLRRYRVTAGLSQEALAEKAGLSSDAVRALERGRRTKPRPDTLALLFDALDLKSDDRSVLASAIGQPVAPEKSSVPLSAESQMRLPLSPTKLIGRDLLKEQISSLLRDAQIRLLTLTGPGGVGKTTLALAVAHEIQVEFSGGVVFVDFAPISDPNLVPSAMLQALGIRESTDRDTGALLVSQLERRRVLLVLDNLEHLLAAARLIAELVHSCPQVVILATSRTPLRVRAEQRFTVPPLDVPAHSRLTQEIADSPAVQLFLARARSARLDFELTDENAPDIAQICVRLDGLPLAIELAAARVTMMTPSELLDRLTNSLALLSDGPRDLPERHQTLRAAVEWSYLLLNESQQLLFRRLSVFVAGADIDAIEDVCGSDNDVGSVFLGDLTNLMENSLLRSVGTPARTETRIGMLETVRQYAFELLSGSGERDAVRRLHSDYFRRLAEDAGPNLVGSRQAEWLARLDREHDNLRAALEWARETADVETGLRISVGLWRYWWTRGYLSEGRDWFDTFLDEPDGVPPGILASALSGMGILAWAQGDGDQAIRFHDRALTTWQAQGDTFGVAKALNNLGLVALDQGRFSDAIHLYEQSLELHRSAGTPRSVAGALLNFGSVLLLERRWDQADAILHETLCLYQKLEDTWGIADTYRYFGAMALEREDLVGASTAIRESLSRFDSIGDLPGVATCLDYLACIAAKEGGVRLAARYHGAATAIRIDHDMPIQSSMRVNVEHMVESVRAALGHDRFNTLIVAGQSTPLDEIVCQAITVS